jgi:hypothetical protein
MATRILRPTPKGADPNLQPWLLRGAWGDREYPAMSRVDLYGVLREELIAAGVMAPHAPQPSNEHHDHVSMLVAECSWKDGRWVRE